MIPRFRPLIVALGLGVALAALLSAAAQPQGKDQSKPKPKPTNEIIQAFPANDAMRTAWKVHYSTAAGFGLIIDGAWFKKAPKEPWFQVLGDARLSEMFVPYHSGSPRFWDVSYNFSLIEVGKDEAGPFGRVLGDPPTVVQELRDRGIAWVDGTKGSRRGQTMVLWGCLNAANYRYLIEYGFLDDGTITFRVGSTGRNYGSREFEGHMHNGLWRVDVNVGGPANSVYVMEHIEPDGFEGGKARTDHRPFNQGREGFEDWDARKFTMLTVQNGQKNAASKPVAYDVMTPRMGVARHYGPDEEACTQHDFWVTRNRPGEIYYQKAPKYAEKGESILNTDVVIWLSTAGHHEPRSEDGEMKEKTGFVGATPVMWCGFELRPRNLWDKSPNYP
jgi:primary-amine oxidase